MFPSSISTTITIYHPVSGGRADDTLQRTQADGVFYGGSKSFKPQKSGDEPAVKAVIYIPAHLGITPQRGDILLRGVGTEAESISDLQRAYPDCVRVLEVRDCRFGSPDMHHWEVRAG